MTDDSIRPLRKDDLAAAEALIAAVDLFPVEMLPGFCGSKPRAPQTLPVNGRSAAGLAFDAKRGSGTAIGPEWTRCLS